MPWSISKRSEGYCVIKDDDGSVAGCHSTREEAADQIRALYASEREDGEDAALLLAEVRQLLLTLSPVAEEAAVEEVEVPVQEATYFAWEGPITYEGIETGDRRIFQENAVRWDESLLPFPFKWQRVSAEGHDASITIGRVDSVFRAEDGGGAVWGRGIILSGPDAPPEAQEYINLLKAGAAGGVSIDGDSAKFEIEGMESGDPGAMRMVFSEINIRALTAVDIPAFAGAKIRLVDDPVLASVEYSRADRPRDWIVDDEVLVASLIPVDPPRDWFDDPQLSELTPITITDDGRIFGHLCGKETCHIGYGSCKTSPRNCDYDSYFHLGELKTAEGDIVYVGHMTYGGGHAPLDQSAQTAAMYYDSTSRVSADIRCGEDEHGTWVAGALRPGLSAEDIREIRSAPLSGDWRPINKKLQLIAAHAVNVPGFPIPRAKVMVASGGETETVIITDEICDCDSDEFQTMLFELDVEEMEE